MANENLKYLLMQRNPMTHATHRRQAFWQIFLPLAVAIFIVIVIAILVTLASMATVSKWAEISFILMVSILMVFLLLYLGITIFSIYLLRRALKYLPFYAFRSQEFLFRLGRRTRYYSNRTVEPFLRYHSYKAGATALLGRSRRTGKTS